MVEGPGEKGERIKQRKKVVFTPQKIPSVLPAGSPTAQENKTVSVIAGRYKMQGSGRLIDLPKVTQLVSRGAGIKPASCWLQSPVLLSQDQSGRAGGSRLLSPQKAVTEKWVAAR